MATKLDMSNLRSILVLELVLAAVFVAVLAKSVLPLLSAEREVVPPSGGEMRFAPAVMTAKLDTSILSTFDPFHREAKPIEVSAQFEESAPETKLDLQVYGMRADIGGETSSAIIQTPDDEQATYFIGDEIIPGVILERVDIDFVILDRNGVKERLSRQGKAETDKAISRAIEMAALAFKAQDMINDLRFYPHREGRNVIGYRMRSRRGKSLDTYGFKQNDIVTAINGESLSQSRVNLPMLWKNLKQARYASIQIIRDDMPMTIEVNLQ